MIDKMLSIICDPQELWNYATVGTANWKQQLSRKILMTQYTADNFSGHMTLEGFCPG